MAEHNTDQILVTTYELLPPTAHPAPRACDLAVVTQQLAFVRRILANGHLDFDCLDELDAALAQALRDLAAHEQQGPVAGAGASRGPAPATAPRAACGHLALARVIRAEMERQNLKPRDVARRARNLVSHGTIWNILNERTTNPSPKTIRGIAKGLGVFVATLYAAHLGHIGRGRCFMCDTPIQADASCACAPARREVA